LCPQHPPPCFPLFGGLGSQLGEHNALTYLGSLGKWGRCERVGGGARSKNCGSFSRVVQTKEKGRPLALCRAFKAKRARALLQP